MSRRVTNLDNARRFRPICRLVGSSGSLIVEITLDLGVLFLPSIR